ncbi:epoxide hydrolase family protein [Microbacterium stercoris]|uniref:Epoxide hydrolase n=1 Tax=Microbacterium stercoris TaxID=2820289 RepID=A0A939TXW2_9MICO|nr:epoxide hydrolase [Microbacterium stercoris]MBO3664082.1 epoxide hydrolase [Microbacterium stercoris]
MTLVRPFRFRVADEELDDLRGRLERARLLPDSPRRPPAGMTGEWLRELVATWRDDDWRAREEWLASFPQFLADIQGTEIHFVHLRAEDADAPVLLVMHGWPHTFALQLDFAAQLTDFHVVVASLPGFAFSQPYSEGPFTERRVADTMHLLMTEVLGYTRYLTYGEDISAYVSDRLAAEHPEHVAGIVATHAHFPLMAERDLTTDAEERAFFDRMNGEFWEEGGYAHVQGTRPDVLAAALNDSPVGLLAWVAEKFAAWGDLPDPSDPQSIEQTISRERILTEAAIYWFTRTIATSFRPYYESEDEEFPLVRVPASVHIQRHEHDYPESLARTYYQDLRTFERLDRGGHFTVAEVPSEMAARVRRFAADVW